MEGADVDATVRPGAYAGSGKCATASRGSSGSLSRGRSSAWNKHIHLVKGGRYGYSLSTDLGTHLAAPGLRSRASGAGSKGLDPCPPGHFHGTQGSTSWLLAPWVDRSSPPRGMPSSAYSRTRPLLSIRCSR